MDVTTTGQLVKARKTWATYNSFIRFRVDGTAVNIKPSASDRKRPLANVLLSTTKFIALNTSHALLLLVFPIRFATIPNWF